MPGDLTAIRSPDFRIHAGVAARAHLVSDTERVSSRSTAASLDFFGVERVE